MKKSIKIFIMTIFMLLIFFSNENIYASSNSYISNEVIYIAKFNPDNWKPDSTTEVLGADKTKKFANKIIGGVQVIGSCASVIMLMIIGVRYIFGSVEEKAEYKKTLKPYVIGAVLLFGITNILVVIQKIVRNF